MKIPLTREDFDKIIAENRLAEWAENPALAKVKEKMRADLLRQRHEQQVAQDKFIQKLKEL